MNKSFTRFENFGHSLYASSYVVKAGTSGEIYEAFQLARKSGLTITPRGNGRSYNNVALNGGGIVLDTSRMNRILKWDGSKGLVICEPGVTLQQLWQRVLP